MQQVLRFSQLLRIQIFGDVTPLLFGEWFWMLCTNILASSSRCQAVEQEKA